ncbi:MAG: choice-of-anchor Q domain-containing protein [Lentimicrobiaceae bacterium]
MKHTILLIALLILCSNSFATSVTVSGTVSGSWTADTILVEGDLIVPSLGQLVISPGTIVMFQSYFRMDVKGSVWAKGIPGDTILFTIRDTTNFNNQPHGRGGWSGIRFRQLADTEDSSLFAYCRFEFSKATEDSTNGYGGAILAYGFDKLRISNCLFFHNYSHYSGGAIYLDNSDAIVEKCVFVRNYSGNTGIIYGYGGGICAMNSSPAIIQSEFYDNSSTGIGGAVSFDNSDPIFENNIMQHNHSALGGALGVLRSSPAHTFSNNLIANNEAQFFGGGICCIRSFPVFSNLTITGNATMYGGGFYCNDSAAPLMYNSVIWGNTGLGPSVYIWDVYSAPSFYYCNIEGDTTAFGGSGAHLGFQGQYLNNLNENPDFLESGIFPFQLIASSPCIDAGTLDAGFLSLPSLDLAGNQRIVNNCIDMGAYEYNSSASIQPHKEIPQTFIIYPNPFKLSTTMVLLGHTDEARVVITNIGGRIIKCLNINLNDTLVRWDGCDDQGKEVPKGIYFVMVKTTEKYYSGKVIKI